MDCADSRMSTSIEASRIIGRLAAISAVLISVGMPGACQDMPPEAPDTVVTTSRDTYRLRIENAQYGRIEVSIDCGEHFMLVGRVTRPAIVSGVDRQAQQAGTIVRSGADGIALAVAAGQVIKILPAAPVSRFKPPDCAVLTDIKPKSSLFGEFGPPVGTPVLEQIGRGDWRPMPEGFEPTDDAILALVVKLPELHTRADTPTAAPDPAMLARLAEIRKRWTALSSEYTSQAVARAQESKRPVVSGVLVLRPRLPDGEPEPITAITYRIDGEVLSAQNSLPSSFGWDTTRVPNGEHVVEIRALSKYATVVTRVRALVVVNNP